jgi:hypothetical protein
MTFKPASKASSSNGQQFERSFNPVAPKEGLRKARVSLIVDLGIQPRDPYEAEDGTITEKKPCQQVAVFVDLVNDKVDYGGQIGKKHYRLPLNKVFKGEFTGIGFYPVAPKDKDGKTIEGKPWGFHPNNMLSKLAKACGRPDVAVDDSGKDSLNIEALLGLPLMVQVEVKKTEDKNGKKDDKGNVITYTNVNVKGLTTVPLDDDDNPQTVAALEQDAILISFDDAKKEDVMFIRPGLRAKIKQAKNYAGSAMQAAIEAFEAENGGSEGGSSTSGSDSPKQAPKPQAKASAAAGKAKAAPVDEDPDESPF